MEALQQRDELAEKEAASLPEADDAANQPGLAKLREVVANQLAAKALANC